MFSFIFVVVIIQVLIIKIIIISHEVSVVIHPAERAMEAEGASATTTSLDAPDKTENATFTAHRVWMLLQYANVLLYI